MKNIFSLIVLCTIVSFYSNGQCTPSSGLPVIACGTGTPLTDNANINTGDTYYYNGAGGSFSNISVNGGTLVLCGSVTISGINFNGGRVVINSGASVTFNNNFNGSDNDFYNSGAVVFNLDVTVQGTNPVVYNATGASITVNGSLTVFDGGLFINNGTAVAQGIIINSGASICLGPSSISQSASISNNQTDAVSVPSGNACVSYSNSFAGNNPIITAAGLIICQNPGASAPAPAVIGAATVIPDCVNCNTALPLELISFTGEQAGSQVELQWTTAREENVKSFAVEQSTDGRIFKTMAEVTPHNKPSTYTFTTPIAADSYFRLKMIDEDGRFTYSPIVLVKIPTGGCHLSILSNPVSKSYAELSIYLPHAQNGEFTVMDNLGRPLKRMPVALMKGNNNLHLDVAGLSVGQYYLYFSGAFEKSTILSFIRL